MNEQIIDDLGILAAKLMIDVQQTIEKIVFGESGIIWLILSMSEKEDKIHLLTLNSQCLTLDIFLKNIKASLESKIEKDMFLKVLEMVFEEINISEMYIKYLNSNYLPEANNFHIYPQNLILDYKMYSQIDFVNNKVDLFLIKKKY